MQAVEANPAMATVELKLTRQIGMLAVVTGPRLGNRQCGLSLHSLSILEGLFWYQLED
jgi:hypothetical protein